MQAVRDVVFAMVCAVVAFTIVNYVKHPYELSSQRVTLPQYCVMGTSIAVVFRSFPAP